MPVLSRLTWSTLESRQWPEGQDVHTSATDKFTHRAINTINTYLMMGLGFAIMVCVQSFSYKGVKRVIF